MDGVDERIRDFTENYMEKLFYFCLKKTGESVEAEDLLSDISVCVLTELRKGRAPDNFPAWVWRIARNRYGRWAGFRHKKRETTAGCDIGDYELADDFSVEGEFLLREDLALLRRELAFISSNYRDIVVAYYNEDQSVVAIAGRLAIPNGTVMSKLFRARKILKEGMEMAREFGAMSYKPENVGFIMNGICGKTGEPLTSISRSLCKNLLLAAYRTPSTAEELSVELGVALPYTEDELERLVGTTLMKKNGGRYETNIFIVSAPAQDKINENLRGITPELTEAIIAST